MLQSRNFKIANMTFNAIHEKHIFAKRSEHLSSPHALPFIIEKIISKVPYVIFKMFRLAVSIYHLKMKIEA